MGTNSSFVTGYPCWQQGSWGQHGAHLGPTGPRCAPCWPHELRYLGLWYLRPNIYHLPLPICRSIFGSSILLKWSVNMIEWRIFFYLFCKKFVDSNCIYTLTPKHLFFFYFSFHLSINLLTWSLLFLINKNVYGDTLFIGNGLTWYTYIVYELIK